MARRRVFERYPLVFYEEDKELYNALKRASKDNRGSLRATILNALEAHLGEDFEERVDEPQLNVNMGNAMGDW